jgi:uncharacterized protein (TIGR03435 family)
MAYFASRLQEIARSYLRHPVFDETGLDGAWDFTLTFHPAPPPDGGKEGKKGDERPRISIFSAVQRELGLKLNVQKRLTPIFVLDHIEQKPTEN